MLLWPIWRFCFFAKCGRVLVKVMRLFLVSLRQPEASELVYMQRQIWSSPPFVEDSMSFDRDYSQSPFVNQRQASPLTCRDKYGHLLLSSKTQSLSTETILSFPSSTRGKWARWHAKTNMAICSIHRRLKVFWPRLFSVSLRQPEASEPIDT